MTVIETCHSVRALRLTRTFASIAVLSAVPVTGFAVDLTVGLDTTYVHDTNFYRTETDEESANSIEPAATITLDHRGDRARYDARYKGSYQEYDDKGDAGGPEHRFRLRGQYDYDQLTNLRFNNNFRDIRNLRYTRDDIRDGDTGQDPRDNRYQRNDLELMLHRDLTRTWELELTASHQFIDFNRNATRSDSDSIGAGARVLYRLAPRHRFGGGVSWIQQEFDGDDFRLDADAEYLLADLAWVFDIGDQVQLTINGGPAWIDTSEDPADFIKETVFVGGSLEGEPFRANVRSCGFDTATGTGIASQCDFTTPGADPIPADDLGGIQSYALADGGSPVDEDETTFFGGAALQARFSDWTVDAEIRRQQSPPSGDTIAAELTRFRWEFGYAPPLGRWSAWFAGSVERRESFSNSSAIDYIVVPGPAETAQRSEAFTRVRDAGDRRDAFTALVGVGRQFTRNFSGEVGIAYRQTDHRRNNQETDSDTYFFSVTLSYVFDAYRF